MHEIKIFENPRFGKIRTIEIEGEPWFVGKDVAEVLRYQNPSKALADHVDAEDKLNNETLSSLGQNRLFEWLRNNGFLIRRKGSDYNMPTQKAMEMGLFEIQETAIPHSDGHITVSLTPKVSGKGQKYFVNRFLQGVKQDV